jgi:hypothetical protein
MGFLKEWGPVNALERLGLPNPGEDYIKGPERAAQISADATLTAARDAEALNRERYAEALGMTSPYMEREAVASRQLMAEMGLGPGERSTAYMDTPGYQAAVDEALRSTQQASRMVGSNYGGRAMEASARAGAGVQQQYYNNYMSMLQGLASPQVTQNVASLGMGQGATIGGQNIQAAQSTSAARMQGAQATQQAQGDLLGAAVKMAAFL